MRVSRTLVIAFASLGAHPFRAFLAALGVVFGVAAVVAMMAIGEGARIESLRQIEALGVGNIVVRSVKPSSGEQASASSIAAYGVTRRDIRHVRTVFDNVRAVVPVRDMRRDVLAEGEKTDVRLFATTPGFFEVTGTRLAESRGRLLDDRDEEGIRPVCVLGRTAARTLFGVADPLGRSLSIWGSPFRVVGIVENPAGLTIAGGQRIDHLVLVPLATAEALYGQVLMKRSSGSFERTRVAADYLYVAVRDVEGVEDTAARLRTYLASTHPEPDYEIVVPYELLKQRASTQRIFTIVMASIAAISLLVGGIGIMNIMLANIYERTREIGTRRALGARRVDVLVQFLAESVLLTAIGGGLGVLLGYGLAETVRRYAAMPTEVTPVSVAVSLAVSIGTGVAFGTYPAWKAATLSPIEALRRE